MKVYEVFVKKPGKDPFEHVGSFEASDDEMAALLARETYLRRAEGEVAWVVAREDIIELPEPFIRVNAQKEQRFNDGAAVANWRRSRRSE